MVQVNRHREEMARGASVEAALARALATAGRAITFSGLTVAIGLADVALIKAIGLGMAIAVAVDATIVRALIVPAPMRLLGRLNWRAYTGVWASARQ